MNRLATFFVVALGLFCLASNIISAQAPATASTTIEGFVIDSVTGQPVEGVHVAILEGGQPFSEEGIQSLLSAGRPTVQTPQVTKILPASTLMSARTTHSVLTDARGKFTFTAVKPGPYVVAFRSDGYTYQVYGQRSDSLFVPATDIHEGKNDLGNFPLRPESQINGRIVDSAGVPIGNIPVFLVKAQPSISVDGDRQFAVAGEASTDATGSYSLKKIVAGRYYIVAGSFGRTESIAMRPTPGGGYSSERIPALIPYPFTYYPGVPDITLAGQVDVMAGNKVAVGDMVVTKGELKSIRGRVVDYTTGRPPESVRVVLNSAFPFPRSGRYQGEILRTANYDRATGAFELINLIPGHYRVDAVLPKQPTPGQQSATIGNVPTQSAFHVLELKNTDIDLVLSVPNNGRMIGKVAVADGKPMPVDERSPPLSIPLQLMLRPLTPLQPAPTVTSVSIQDGTFEVGSALEGKYRFSITPLRDNYYVSETRLNGVRVTTGILDIPGNVASELILTLSPGGEVQGLAVDKKGQPVRQAKGVVLPEPLPEIISYYQSVTADNTGHFTARGVPPGNHKIYIWDGAEQPQVFDRELLARSRALAFPIRIDSGERPSVSVPIIAP